VNLLDVETFQRPPLRLMEEGQTTDLIEKEMENFYNVQYYGSLFVGSAQKEMTFIYDTGSSVRAHCE